MKPIRVLVFPCGSEIGLEIYSALRYSTHVTLYGASSVTSNHGKYLYDNYIDGIPYIDSPDFIEHINAVVEANQIDYIFPAHDSVLTKLSEEREMLHAGLIASAGETCTICRSKRATYEKFRGIVPVPRVYALESVDVRFPAFMKPDIGQGSKGTYLATSRVETEFYLRKDPSLLVLEYLPGKEYTIDCFSDRLGKLRFVGARERIRVMNGISVNTRPVIGEAFTRLAETINNNLSLRGAWFFQVKENNHGELTLMEIAPRIAGSMGLYRSLGVNFALLSIYDAFGLDVEILVNDYDIEMDRALTNRYTTDLEYDHVYIDLDDCIVDGDKLNITVVAFLYQCIAKSIKIHLITRHNGDLANILAFYRIESLFETVTHIGRCEIKSRCIKETKSIFVDDSFSERLEVKQALGIPVFAPDALECLMNGK